MFRVALSPLCPLRHSLGSIVNPNLRRSGYCGVLDRGYQNWVCREITDSFLVCERDCVARREESAWGSISLCHGFSGYLLFGWIIVACYYHQGIECWCDRQYCIREQASKETVHEFLESTVARIVLNSFLASEDHRILKMAAIENNFWVDVQGSRHSVLTIQPNPIISNVICYTVQAWNLPMMRNREWIKSSDSFFAQG